MKRRLLSIFVMILGISIYFSEVKATYVYKDTYSFSTQEKLKDTEILINGGTYAYSSPAQNYDFLDENGVYNTVYVSENNVFWSKLDDNNNLISTVSWPLVYNVNNETSYLSQIYKDLTYNFGGAIYYNEHLYVMYSRLADSDTLKEQFEENTMAMAKYDKNGNMVNVAHYKGKELNASTYYDNNGTWSPFYSANCSLAVNDGKIACFFGRNMYNSHQSSLLMFIDPETLEFLSNMRSSNVDAAMYYYVYNHSISHSLGERIIPLSDGGFLMMEVGDASSTRGLMLTKVYKEYNAEVDRKIYNKSTRRMFHFSEGGPDTWGYNNTYSVLGNLIEVDDGYIYVGSSEKTLSMAYGNNINESWNIFVQKYDKDFNLRTKSDENVQLLKTEPVRSASGKKAEYNGSGRLYLTGNEKDYGVKWLTDFNLQAAINVRALKLNNDLIAILWEQFDLKEWVFNGEFKGYQPVSDFNRDVYYMIIDRACNVVITPKKISNAVLNNEEHYVYKEKDKSIYWTHTLGGKAFFVNKLDLSPVYFTFKENSVEVEGLGGNYNIDGTTVNITGKGKYIFTGKCSKGYINAADDVRDVDIVLDNLDLASDKADKSTINIGSGIANVRVVLADDTENKLDNSNNNGQNSLRSLSDLIITGNGKLTVKEKGIYVDGDLDGLGTNTIIEVSKNALEVTGNLEILNGTFQIKGLNGIIAKNILLHNGTYIVEATTNGINANGNLDIEKGTYTVTGTGSSSIGYKVTGDMVVHDGTLTTNTKSKGLDVTGNITIEKGKQDITSAIGIASEKNLNIKDGTYIFRTTSKGTDITGTIIVEKGGFDINSATGIFAKGNITFKDGTYKITSTTESVKTEKDVVVEKGRIEFNGATGFNVVGNATFKDGTYIINSNATAIKTTGKTTIEKGTYTLTANVGIDAGGNIVIKDGPVGVTTSGNGIHSAADITIEKGEITVTTTGNGKGIDAGGTVNLKNGTYVINTKGTCIYSGVDTKISKGSYNLTSETGNGLGVKGNTIISGGTFQISSKGHGINSIGDLSSTGANITVTPSVDTSYGMQGKSVYIGSGTYNLRSGARGISSSNGNITVNNGTITANTVHGIYSSANLTLYDGTYTINSTTAYYAGGVLEVIDGKHTLSCSGIAIRSAGENHMGSNRGGCPEITINSGTKGIDGTKILIYSGDLHIYTSSHAINASDSISIANGDIYINISGNGTGSGMYAKNNINMSNGKFVAYANNTAEVIHYGGTCKISGGLVLACALNSAPKELTLASGSKTMLQTKVLVRQNEYINVKNASGAVVLSAKVPKACSYQKYIPGGSKYTIEKGTSSAYTCSHTSKSTIGANAATCTEKGYTGDIYCTSCKSLLTIGKLIDATGHSWNAGVITKQPTATEDGQKTYTCSKCSSTKTETYVCPHSSTEVRSRVEATCDAPGTEGDTYCKTCGRLLSKGVEIPATGHDWDEGELTQNPTPTENGILTYTCSKCNKTRTEEYVCKHKDDPILEGQRDANCAQKGYTGDYVCPCCHKVYTLGQEIEKTDHTWDEGRMTKNPTPTEDGEVTFKCVVCGEEKVEGFVCGHPESIPANAVDATCTEDGYSADMVCSLCGKILVRGHVIPALGHDLVNEVILKYPTTTEEGEKESTCSRCHETFRETIDKIKFTVTFDINRGATIDVYHTNASQEPEEVEVTSTFARDLESGDTDSTGTGKVKFKLNIANGNSLESIVADSLGELEDLGNGYYLISNILGDMKVTINTKIDYRKGDVSRDTFINSTDAALVLDFFKNQNATEMDYALGDMNEDNYLNATDASLILDIFKNEN